MNKPLHDFLMAKGIPYTKNLEPNIILLSINDAEEFLRIARDEQIAIIGADVYEKISGTRYSIEKTFDLAWSCDCNDGEDITFKSYYDRSIEMAKIGLCRVRDRMKNDNNQLYINFVLPNN